MAEAGQSDSDDAYRSEREQMVTQQLRGRDIRQAEVLAAFGRVPRHRFVPESLRHRAYEDGPLAIGHGQTISQPYVVAYMIQLARVKPGDRVLDVGGGSGYQAAILAEMQCQVVSVEIVPELAQQERQRLAELGYGRVTVLAGDCRHVLSADARFDAIIAAAAPAAIPQTLVTHLASGGRLVIPVGERDQELVVIEKLPHGQLREELYGHVSFVPMTGDGGD